jgi:hypothetical protein
MAFFHQNPLGRIVNRLTKDTAGNATAEHPVVISANFVYFRCLRCCTHLLHHAADRLNLRQGSRCVTLYLPLSKQSNVALTQHAALHCDAVQMWTAS